MTDTLITTIHTKLNQQKHIHQHNRTRLEHHHPGTRIQMTIQEVQRSKKRIAKVIDDIMQIKQHHLASNIEKLTILNPLHTMNRGFSITYNKTNELIKSVDNVTRSEERRVEKK